MELSYDSRYNVAYIRFKEKSEEVDTIKLSDDVNIDITSDGRVYGIEFLNANEQIDLFTFHKFLFINNETGEKKKLILKLMGNRNKKIRLKLIN